MSNVNITPQTVLLTSGQSATFEASDSVGKPLPVSWGLNPPVGTLVTPTSGGATPTPATSAAYVAPTPLPSGAQTVAIVASTANDSASATIFLTPVSIVPAKVDLKTNQQQRFVVSVEGPPPGATTEKITWILSPELGTLEHEPGNSDDRTVLYKAPTDIPDPTAVNVIATTPNPGERAKATINLTSPPWQGLGVDILGAYLLVVFSLVFLMLTLWPPALPSPDTAKANRIEANGTLETLVRARATRMEAKNKPQNQAPPKNAPKNTASATNNNGVQPTAPETTSETNAASPDAANVSDADMADLERQIAEAREELKSTKKIEGEVNDTYVHTKLVVRINRELDLLYLVLLAGTLGSFLHTAQSYSEYVGNRTLKSSWVWWYSFRPFIGAGLALVFYAAVRGGFMAIATGSSAKASELNPFGVVSVAAMVGMFSKAATVKLGEVFDTVFKTEKPKETKDPVAGSSQTSTQAPGKTGTGNAAAPTGAK